VFECDIGAIGEHHHIGSSFLEAEHIVGRVLDVEVSVYEVFLSHEAKIPIGNVMMGAYGVGGGLRISKTDSGSELELIE
jgi:hypothetical protein